MQRIKNKLQELRLNKEFDDFINFIIPFNPIIYGGFVRDILCNNEPKDMDIVLLNAYEGIKRIPYSYTLNKFNGMRLRINNQDIDLWRIEDTLWIKHNQLEPTINSLFKGTNYFKNRVAYSINQEILYKGK